MRGVRNPLPFTHPLLRKTVVRLLLTTVPPLSLAACGLGSDCDWEETVGSVYLEVNHSDGRQPTDDTCMELCRERGFDPTSCDAFTSVYREPDGTSRVVHKTQCRYVSGGRCSNAPSGCTGPNGCNDGRAPEGLKPGRVEATCALGALFAQMAWLEAASVPAFLRLADELKAHGAPEALVRAARRSAGDEVRHTRAIGALARRHGAAVPQVELEPFSERSLEAMVLENAREGCVRETYGAVVAGWQARNAKDEQVRVELARIAEDELRHAELAWAVDAWAAERLSPEARQRVHAARLEAYRELEQLVAKEEREDVLIQDAGLPPRDAALRLLQGLHVLVA
jgi:hypothetical protein